MEIMKGERLIKRCVITGSILALTLWSLLFSGLHAKVHAKQETTVVTHTINPGDTWQAVAWQHGVEEDLIRRANQNINRMREPSIGTQILVPSTGPDSAYLGRLVRSDSNGINELAAKSKLTPWKLTILNGLNSPYSPLLNQLILVPDEGSVPRELPPAFNSLELESTPARPGQAIGFRAELEKPVTISATLENVGFQVSQYGHMAVGVAGTGAFYPPGNHNLSIFVEGNLPWIQPLSIEPGQWTYEEIYLTGSAAAIDQASIREEWERLSVIWSHVSDGMAWRDSFELPIDNFLEFSSFYGANRSYNGGPYSSYHEGVDFSAYGGTPVYAPAGGTVTIAESLYVRGGAVIIDHGVGVYSGLYHMSDVLVQPGQLVEHGQLIGRVGSTGLSTGNHLHWDLLVGGTQVDGLAWLESDFGCWLLEGIGNTCGQDSDL